MQRFAPVIGLIWLAGAAGGAEPAADAELSPAELKFFESKVRPVLVTHCYECHSADAKKLRANLRLDHRDGWRLGGDSGPALVPGQPEDSRLIEAVGYGNRDLRMPPKGKLPPEAIEALTQWVKMGAPDPRIAEGEDAAVNRRGRDEAQIIEQGRDFWSFRRPVKHDPPAVSDAAWPRNDIDRFVLARLEPAGLSPAPQADRRTLIRRVYFDLTGLPPTPDAVQAFVLDARPTADAFADVVDRLLASPRFGERWGRHWLDVARFAESSGGGRELVFPEAWRYRDYVIASFNADKPYDTFVRQQIAGDLMDYSSDSQRADNLTAVGYLAMGPTNYELQDKELLRMEVVDEQIDTMGRTFLGMTLGCARCHDHKFDPVPTRDYYALAGIFRSTKTLTPGNVSGYETQELPVPDEQRAALEAHAAKVNALEQQIKQANNRLAKLDPKAAADTAQAGEGRPVVLASTTLPGIVIDDDKAELTGSWTLSTSVRPYVDDGYRHASSNATATYTFEAPAPGRYHVRLAFSPNPNRANRTPVIIEHADGKATVRINQRARPNVDGVFHSLGAYPFSPDKPGRVTIGTEGAGGVVILDALQVMPAEPAEAAVAQEDDDETNVAEEAAKAKRAEQAKEVRERIKQLEAELNELKKNAPPSPPQVMAVREMPDPGDWHLHIRGGIRNLGPKVERGFLSVAWDGDSPPAIPEDASGRLELANWIASADNPLTARVMVNRIWQHLFAEGIVRTPDNFGATGRPPTHPELLDWLAVRFVEEGWSVKRMIRLIVTSRTYQMDSAAGTPSGADPENHLLSHQNRKRLDAESIYDAMLSVSGELDMTAGGLTMRPGTRSSYGYRFETGRRGVYLPVFRNAIPDLFEVFDFADPNLVIGKRPVSTLPTQALFMLNSPMVMEQAEQAARRLLADEQFAQMEPAGRIDFVYERTLGRPPTAGERDLTLRHLASFNDEQAAWTSVQHALFASLDFRYVD